MDSPTKSGSAQSGQDSKTEQSNISAKTKEHKALDVIKAELDEKTAKPGDASSAKGPENRERDWPALRWKLIESKMATHANTSKEFAKLEATAEQYELSIPGYIEAAREKPAAKEQTEEIERHLSAQRTELLAHIKAINSRENLREARNTINNLHNESSPSSEELDIFNKSIEDALKIINDVNNEKIALYKKYNQEQEEQTTKFEKIIIDSDPKASESSSKDDASSRKRPREDETEAISSTDDTASTDDGPSKKKTKLKSESGPGQWYEIRKKLSESLIQSGQNNTREALQELNEKKDDIATWDQDIKDLIESRIPAAKKRAAAHVPEIIELKMTEDLEAIQSTLEEAKEQLNKGLKDTISKSEAKKAHQLIKSLLDMPVPETIAGLNEFDQVIREATKTKVDHCNQRTTLYEQYGVIQLEQMKKLGAIEELYDKSAQEHDDPEQPSSTEDTPSTKDTPQPKKAKLEESWPARRKQFVESKMAEHKKTEEELVKLEASAENYDVSISAHIEAAAREKPGAKEQISKIEAYRASQHAEFFGRTEAIDSRDEEANNTIISLIKDENPPSEELDAISKNIEDAFKVIVEGFNEKIKLYKQYIQAQEADLAKLKKIITQPDSKDSEPSSSFGEASSIEDDANNRKRRREERIKTPLETSLLKDDTDSQYDAPSRKKTKREKTEYNIGKRKIAFDKLVKDSIQAANEASKKLAEKVTSRKKYDQDFRNLLVTEIPNAAQEIAAIQQSFEASRQYFQKQLEKHADKKEFDEIEEIMRAYIHESYPKTTEEFNTSDRIVRYLTQGMLKHFEKRTELYEQYSKEQIQHIASLGTILEAHRRNVDYASWKDPESSGEEDMQEIKRPE